MTLKLDQRHSRSGSPKRELLHVDDLADACVFLMKHCEHLQHINTELGRGIRETYQWFLDNILSARGLEKTLVAQVTTPDTTNERLRRNPIQAYREDQWSQ